MRIRLWNGKPIRLWPIEAQMHRIAPYFSLVCLAIIALSASCYTLRMHSKHEQAVMCMAENIYHEERGESQASMYVQGMITIARMSDPDPQWPKTICGVVAQHKQFSWVLDYALATTRDESRKWKQAQYVARDLIDNAWSMYVLPKGWECARFYHRKDGTGVSANSKRFANSRLFPVGGFDKHTAFQEKRGCKYPLPTSNS